MPFILLCLAALLLVLTACGVPFDDFEVGSEDQTVPNDDVARATWAWTVDFDAPTRALKA